MPTKPKIKIIDNAQLRAEIETLYDLAPQVTLAQWAIECAEHILFLSEIENIDISDIYNGILTNQRWQNGKASVHEVRQAGFKVHGLARQCQTEIGKNAIRTAGHAVAVGHMREHAMVCSDYAIKTVQLAFADDIEKIDLERQWQLNTLKVLIAALTLQELRKSNEPTRKTKLRRVRGNGLTID